VLYTPEMKLFGTALSPYAMRVMIAARFKGIELASEAPPFGTRSREHLARNPVGKVPVLVDGDLVLPESDVILSYLEDRFPEPTLYPGDAAARANVRLLCRLVDSYSAPSFGPFLANNAAAIAVASERIDSALGFIDHFRRDGQFASGDAFSAADCALIPFFHAFAGLEARFHTYSLVRKRPRLDAWWSRARASALGVYACTEIDQAVGELFKQRA
jgi:glutathione S-transferase